MNCRLVVSCLLTLVAAPAIDAATGTELANVAHLLTLGRRPTPTETVPENETLRDRIDALKKRLGDDATEQRAVVTRSYRDAFGRRPTARELSDYAHGVATYTQLMKVHFARLTANPREYDAVVQRAYQLVINRSALAEEVTYWRGYGSPPFALLVAGVDNWARRNQPGLMVTTGKPTLAFHCAYLSTAQTTAAEATIAREIVDAAIGPVIAVGGRSLLSDGSIEFIAAGTDRLLESYRN